VCANRLHVRSRELPESGLDSRVRELLAGYRRRMCMASLAAGVIVGAAASALAALAILTAGIPLDRTRVASLAVAVVVGSVAVRRWWRDLTPARVARAVEVRSGRLDNLLVTAEQVLRDQRGAVRMLVREALYEQAVERLDRERPATIQPLGWPVTLATGALLALTALLAFLPHAPNRAVEMPSAAPSPAAAPLGARDLRVVITPPAYVEGEAQALVNPTTITAIEGSRIQLEAAGPDAPLVGDAGGAAPFVASASGWTHQFTARESRALVIWQSAASHRTEEPDRVIALRVVPDGRPVVRITTPAKDLMFPAALGRVPIEIEARDDLGVATLALRYTKVSGSGEGFTFVEGELPLHVTRNARDARDARTTLNLDELKLEDGDTVVYRAVATDRKPGGEPASSESFLVEIGRLSGVSSTGFALPDDRERQGLSQQMLIVKTERLHAARASLGSEAFEEQSRLLAVEQRMVRAEFVFMTGGEVEDEVEEATHGHELAEGRLENQSQLELLAAIREMSRAEARLNASDTAQALVFERAALKALQRAFDRRRYLLRTLPERARIDFTRRLSGDLAAARPAARSSVAVAPDPVVERARQALAALGRATDPGAPSASLAALVLEVDPGADTLQQAAIQISAARAPSERAAARRQAETALRLAIARRLAPGAAGRLAPNPLRGRFADEIASREPR
jgi:hypothetical protein